MVNFQSTPVSNTLAVTIGIGNLVDTIPAGGASVLTKSFNQVFIGNPATAILNQTTAGNFIVAPGNVAYFETNPTGGVDLKFGVPQGTETTVHFG